MNLREAINISQIRAARGYNDKDDCVVSVALYGEELKWLKGFGGNWSKNWETLSDEDRDRLIGLNFKPSGPKPAEQIEEEVSDALKQIRESEDEFEPMGETYE